MGDSLGRVKWFDGVQHHGVVAGVGGTDFFFRRTGAERSLPPLAQGQLVTFDEAGTGRLGQTATNVEPVRGRASDSASAAELRRRAAQAA